LDVAESAIISEIRGMRKSDGGRESLRYDRVARR
jgi:hypothetical protein